VRIGQRLGEYLQRGDLILLQGDLGVGKTQLVKGIVLGLGSDDLVTSPSFVLLNEYRAGSQWPGMRIYHADLYRIEDAAELGAIGMEEAWNPVDICLMEWAERAESWLPAERLLIQMRHLDETKRVLRFVPQGQRYRDLVETFKHTVFG
jgi:tRNA threonylcarbamoyladenosine biosynthesis protein TsaE